MHLVFWGTYDTGKPRVRILLEGLRENGVTVTECHAEVWKNVSDKSQIVGRFRKLGLLLSWLSRYPALIIRYLLLPKHDAVVVGYLGHLDVLVLWPFAKIRGRPVIWDAFLSLYDTVVNDRKLMAKSSPLARGLHGWEWLACRAANKVVLDTRAHADYFVSEYNVSKDRTCSVFVGAETDRFPPCKKNERRASKNGLNVLFYGQFIPLHGIGTIVKAARLLKDDIIDWSLIGTGQEVERIRAMLKNQPLPRVQWVPWVPYEELVVEIRRADVCLGIFGSSEKAGRVIPNKVFQAIAAGKPLITRDSPAIRELFSSSCPPEIALVPPMDPVALANAVKHFARNMSDVPCSAEYRLVFERIQPKAIGRTFMQCAEPLQYVESCRV